MVSGMYLGELARLVIREMMEAGLLFPGDRGGTAFGKPYGLATEHLPLLARGDAACLTAHGLQGIEEQDLDVLRRIGGLVGGRSARIAGAAIAAVLTWMDPELAKGHTVAVDGSLFEKYPGYGTGIRETLQVLCGERAEGIRLVLAKDGSGIGSAIAGALAGSGIS
jgi:hexokinase